jgi:hypothetical protein
MDAITELRNELKQVWLALFWTRMNMDAVCPICQDQLPRTAATGKEHTEQCQAHLKHHHDDLLESDMSVNNNRKNK